MPAGMPTPSVTTSAPALSTTGDGGVLIVDETGLVKKGSMSAGVQRQYTGTAGRIENSQVGVFLAYATERGRALIYRRLYRPEHSWCADPERRHAAGVPEDVQFATKPRLAGETIAAALDAGVTASWVTGDEAYGQDPQLRAHLERIGISYVMAVACSTRVRINQGRTSVRADVLADRLPASAWQRHSAGAGAKGPRYYDWAWIHIGAGAHRHLLIRRTRTTRELAFHLCVSPTDVALSELVRVAGVRWSVEECFQAAKSQVGLDHYQVRHWTSCTGSPTRCAVRAGGGCGCGCGCGSWPGGARRTWSSCGGRRRSHPTRFRT